LLCIATYIANPTIGSYRIGSLIHIGSFRCSRTILSIMSETLRKRAREPEALPNSAEVRESKRFNGEDKFTLSEEDEAASSEDFVSEVMRSLEEEISATCSTFYAPMPVDNSWAFDISRGCEGQTLVSDSGIDLCYFVEASDDDLGIPSGPVLDCKDEVCEFPGETSRAEGLSENPDLKCHSENWGFEDEVENYQQSALYEDVWNVQDYMNRDFVSQDMCFDGDFSGAWTLETTGCK